MIRIRAIQCATKIFQFVYCTFQFLFHWSTTLRIEFDVFPGSKNSEIKILAYQDELKWKIISMRYRHNKKKYLKILEQRFEKSRSTENSFKYRFFF